MDRTLDVGWKLYLDCRYNFVEFYISIQVCLILVYYSYLDFWFDLLRRRHSATVYYTARIYVTYVPQ